LRGEKKRLVGFRTRKRTFRKKNTTEKKIESRTKKPQKEEASAVIPEGARDVKK